MKKHLYSLAVSCLSIILLHSCVTSSISKSERKMAYAESKEDVNTSFAKFNDGTIKEYSSLKLVTSPFGTPYLLADGKDRIKAAEIVAYQNNEHYAISQRTFTGARKSHVATETLPGFAVRTVKGKLNVYCKKYYNGQAAVDEFYLQAGSDGSIMPYSSDLMNDIVKNNVEAYNFFNNKKFRGPLQEKVQATAQLYNGGQLMSKN